MGSSMLLLGCKSPLFWAGMASAACLMHLHRVGSDHSQTTCLAVPQVQAVLLQPPWLH